jgi:hypothetical protein
MPRPGSGSAGWRAGVAGSSSTADQCSTWDSGHRPPERGGAGVVGDAPPASRAALASPSAMPSIRPRAAAGAPSVAVSRLGSRAVPGMDCGPAFAGSPSHRQTQLRTLEHGQPGATDLSQGGRACCVRRHCCATCVGRLRRCLRGQSKTVHCERSRHVDPDCLMEPKAGPGR